MSSLAEYLAKNFLNAETPERPKKKRKKTKHHPEDTSSGGGGLTITTDEPLSLRDTLSNPHGAGNSDDDNDEGYTIANSTHGYGTASFRKKKSTWTALSGPTPPSNSDQVAADAIIASAAAERAANAEASEDAPAIVDEEGEEDEGGHARMASGARAGLQTAAQTAAMVAAQARARERDAASVKQKRKKKKGESEEEEEEGETIYRDASGRVINVAMKRAELRKEAEAKAAAEAAEREALTGDVQRRERERRKEELEEAKFIPFARGVEDEDMNRELRERTRWNDPALGFLTEKKGGGGGGGGEKGGGKRVYQGSAPPNRYGIRPGYRWDGVDRSNGFEGEWFAARNKREMNRGLEYQWLMDE
ncbi:hypothetical protein AJ80_09101 [Polytolypa hystricis UAMH7299]|uniref:Pre-mRNA-splicing factor cwc26 n=1 Tax=Polytolypa hystricis (strain UAMH7299) TaxID=1447883 RepID=A0A2B7WW75_POLH7|nr:hypothetical protein AJ80_09101 [Polytolypa hystricis UAMH7299]